MSNTTHKLIVEAFSQAYPLRHIHNESINKLNSNHLKNPLHFHEYTILFSTFIHVIHYLAKYTAIIYTIVRLYYSSR